MLNLAKIKINNPDQDPGYSEDSLFHTDELFMDVIKAYYHIIAAGSLVLFLLAAHLFAPANYSFVKNTISDLGAQGYKRKIIMQSGFVLSGVFLATGVILQGPDWRTGAILFFGIFMMLTGIFCIKPFVECESYAVIQSRLHLAFAQIADLFLVIGILVQVFYETGSTARLIHLGFLIIILVFSLASWFSVNYPGLMQRLLYLSSFIWIAGYYRP